MEVIEFCPINKRNKCTDEIDGQMHRCQWYMPFTSTDKDGKTTKTWRCAFAWVPILQIEALQLMREMRVNIPIAH